MEKQAVCSDNGIISHTCGSVQQPCIVRYAGCFNSGASGKALHSFSFIRYQQQGPDLYPLAFNLNNSLAGRQQIGALMQALPHMPQVTALLLQNNSIDDWALQLLVTALQHPSRGCVGIICLDLGYNRLGQGSTVMLTSLLHRPPKAARAASLTTESVVLGLSSGLMNKAPAQTMQNMPGPAAAPASHPLLTQLVLAGNPVGDSGAEVVCKLVATGDSLLQLLDLSRCGITERLAGCLQGLLEGARWVKWSDKHAAG
eukprot:GHRR01026931.1.p1 GENE.GHRR01026931.1~~GHRR01026931.1.p1  ORF type:complete len:257 (+),score=60.93 GHRR01026931.1:186-956(+)